MTPTKCYFCDLTGLFWSQDNPERKWQIIDAAGEKHVCDECRRHYRFRNAISRSHQYYKLISPLDQVQRGTLDTITYQVYPSEGTRNEYNPDTRIVTYTALLMPASETYVISKKSLAKVIKDVPDFCIDGNIIDTAIAMPQQNRRYRKLTASDVERPRPAVVRPTPPVQRPQPNRPIIPLTPASAPRPSVAVFPLPPASEAGVAVTFNSNGSQSVSTKKNKQPEAPKVEIEPPQVRRINI